MSLEFYIYEGELWVKDGQESHLVEPDSEIVDTMLARIREDYPDAYRALAEEYKRSAPNKRYYHYIMVKRFLKCNFGRLDSTFADIENGKMNFERVDCPLRSECKNDGIICSPIYKTTLTGQEIKIGRLWYEGLSKEEIAGMAYLSPDTINNHIRNIYAKLNIHTKTEFLKYAQEHGLYKD